jgi:xanthosine utilization system XapX-like protein
VAVAFAAKLRMAAAALGCASRKELCAHFRRANPATQCDIDRLNKWVQGRATPRASSVYADLAAVIGTPKPGRWIADSSIEEFAAELGARTGADPGTFRRPDMPGRRAAPRNAGLFGGVTGMSGTFAAYSPAWSPHFRGKLLRGSLVLAASGNGALTATYTESLLGGDVRLWAEVWIGARSMHFILREPEGELPLLISLQIPGPPVSALCGIMSGAAFVSSDPMPSASRIVFVRVPDTPLLSRSNRYFDPAQGAIADDLAALGLTVAEAGRLDAFARGFLGGEPVQVSTRDQATFADILDGEHLHAGAHANDLTARDYPRNG